MTLDQLIRDIDMHLPGNRFDNDVKTMWINEVEGKLYDELCKPAISTQPENVEEITGSETAADYVVQIDPLNQNTCVCEDNVVPESKSLEMKPYIYAEDSDAVLICPDRFCDVYVHYVLAKMHAADSEIDEYNNEVLLYDASYKDYAAWHIRNFRREL